MVLEAGPALYGAIHFGASRMIALIVWLERNANGIKGQLIGRDRHSKQADSPVLLMNVKCTGAASLAVFDQPHLISLVAVCDGRSE